MDSVAAAATAGSPCCGSGNDFDGPSVSSPDGSWGSNDLLRNYVQPSNIADSLKIAAKKQHPRQAVVYESQISPELEGIKLKIKKSPTQEVITTPSLQSKNPQNTISICKPTRGRKPGQTTGTASGRGRKRLKKRKGRSDDEEEDEDKQKKGGTNTTHFTTISAIPSSNGSRYQEASGEQSIWARETMPAEILTKIFMEVTYTEGCVPTLVRFVEISTPSCPSPLTPKYTTNLKQKFLNLSHTDYPECVACGGKCQRALCCGTQLTWPLAESRRSIAQNANYSGSFNTVLEKFRILP